MADGHTDASKETRARTNKAHGKSGKMQGHMDKQKDGKDGKIVTELSDTEK